ncbi:MAG: DUF4189 domain-containing protein [Rhizobiales bacterium]|nr:DUF4189 domain-containing protein [Hyphomicrobiales bacterium]
MKHGVLKAAAIAVLCLFINQTLATEKTTYKHNDNGFNASVEAPNTSNKIQTGRSLGGKIRKGPGIQHMQIGSSFFDNPIKIIANTGILFNGYNWFEIIYAGNIKGYQWGGIMCSDNTKINGIFQKCAQRENSLNPSASAYMAFAIAHDGTFGHAVAKTKKQAESLAMQYCRSSSCKIKHVTTAKCHAYAMANNNSQWFGASNTKMAASNFAMGYCMNGGNACRLEYSQCH